MAPPIYYPYDYHIAIILITAPVDLYGTNPQTSGSSPEPLGSLEDQQRQINDGIRVAKKKQSYRTRLLQCQVPGKLL